MPCCNSLAFCTSFETAHFQHSVLLCLIAEITNFTKELQDFTAKMVDSIRKAGDTVNHPSRMTQIQRSLFQTFR